MKKWLIRDPLCEEGFREPFGMDERMAAELIEWPIAKEYMDYLRRKGWLD